MEENNERERKLSFKCCIPREMSSCTDGELRLSLTTLKNAMVNISICMDRLERELKKRGATTSFFQSLREDEIPEIIDLAPITK